MAAQKSWTKEEEKTLRRLYLGTSWEVLRKALPERTYCAIELKARNLQLKRVSEEKKKEAVVAKEKKKAVSAKKKKEKFPMLLPALDTRDWGKPKEFVIDSEKWDKSSPRVGIFSGLDYKDAGFRAGLIENGFERFADEACRCLALVGRLFNKNWVTEELKRLRAEMERKINEELERLLNESDELEIIVPGMPPKEFFLDHMVSEAAKELAFTIPKIKRPGNKNEYVRIYIISSPPYDGELGEKVARKLQELRPEDVRVYNRAHDRLEIKEVNKAIGLICPERSRLPSAYFSGAVDREVKDKEGQTSLDFPDLWVVGGTSSSVHIPRKGRKPPRISCPSLKRLQSVRVGENQQGVRVVEFTKGSDEYFVRTWSLKDLTKNEGQFITGIKDGAQEIHKKIVEVIKAEGPRPEGLIADALKMEGEREKLREALKFLTEDKMSLRKTWPGLYYDPHSQRYGLHLDWIQERLHYPSLVRADYSEDRLAFFSCLHAGYNTTDYEYFVKDFPEMLWRNKVRHVCCCGDLIAGLSHNFLEQGEVMSGMNYSEQEQFAAELVGTALMKVFERGLQESPEIFKNPPVAIIEKLLPEFSYFRGNHDEWQERSGVRSLITFREKLAALLANRIEALFKKHDLSFSYGDLLKALNAKLVGLSNKGEDYNPLVKLPSDLLIELRHPHMGRANTKSIRGQEFLESSDVQIAGHGNFHTAIVTDMWEPYLGQRVNVEAPTFVIRTSFEDGKNKKVDFGPVYLRVLSKGKRIVMTESAFYGKPRLLQPRPHWTNWQQLKDELGIYHAP